LFIYYTSVPTGTEARTEEKINKQGCGLAIKGDESGENDEDIVLNRLYISPGSC